MEMLDKGWKHSIVSNVLWMLVQCTQWWLSSTLYCVYTFILMDPATRWWLSLALYCVYTLIRIDCTTWWCLSTTLYCVYTCIQRDRFNRNTKLYPHLQCTHSQNTLAVHWNWFSGWGMLGGIAHSIKGLQCQHKNLNSDPTSKLGLEANLFNPSSG